MEGDRHHLSFSREFSSVTRNSLPLRFQLLFESLHTDGIPLLHLLHRMTRNHPFIPSHENSRVRPDIRRVTESDCLVDRLVSQCTGRHW